LRKYYNVERDRRKGENFMELYFMLLFIFFFLFSINCLDLNKSRGNIKNKEACLYGKVLIYQPLFIVDEQSEISDRESQAKWVRLIGLFDAEIQVISTEGSKVRFKITQIHRISYSPYNDEYNNGIEFKEKFKRRYIGAECVLLMNVSEEELKTWEIDEKCVIRTNAPEIKLEVGKKYRFKIFMDVGWPTKYELLIYSVQDGEEELDYFGISTGFLEDLDSIKDFGFSVSLKDIRCPVKNKNVDCGTIRNSSAIFRCGNEEIEIFLSQSGEIVCNSKRYKVYLFLSQIVEYRPYACADWSDYIFSFFLERIKTN
jgi:hypothetical protein